MKSLQFTFCSKNEITLEKFDVIILQIFLYKLKVILITCYAGEHHYKCLSDADYLATDSAGYDMIDFYVSLNCDIDFS